MVVKVGVRELRENLASWLDRVRAGDEVVVTERGQPIARLGPLERRSKLEELIAQGRVTPARLPRTPVDVSKRPRMPPGKTLSDLVVEERRGGRS
jgi:prevent-host-death family protein